MSRIRDTRFKKTLRGRVERHIYIFHAIDCVCQYASGEHSNIAVSLIGFFSVSLSISLFVKDHCCSFCYTPYQERSRGRANLKVDEDVILASAYAHVTTNAATGTDHDGATYWGIIRDVKFT